MRARGRIQLANALNLGISQLWEVDDEGIWNEIRRKTALSDYFISIAFWKSSFYSSYTLEDSSPDNDTSLPVSNEETTPVNIDEAMPDDSNEAIPGQSTEIEIDSGNETDPGEG